MLTGLARDSRISAHSSWERILGHLLFLGILVLFISCETEVLSFESSAPMVQDNLVLEGPVQGTWFSTLEEFYLDWQRLGANEGPWETLNIKLYDQAGRYYYEETLELGAGEGAETPSARGRWAPDLARLFFNPPEEPVVIVAEIQVMLGETLISRESWQYFWVPDWTSEDFHLVFFPQEVFPGSTMIIQARIPGSLANTAQIRWYIDDVLVSQGPAETHLTHFWRSPEREGLHRLNVEVLPSPLVLNRNPRFVSSVVLSSSLIVTTRESTENHELGPPESYYSLLHFRGNSRDSGLLHQGGLPSVVRGEVNPEQDQGFYGFGFDGSSQLVYPYFPLPLEEGGVLAPFTLNMRFLPRNLDRSQNVFRIQDGSGWTMGLQLDPGGGATLTMDTPDGRWFSGVAPGTFLAEVQNLSISLIPEADRITVLWNLDGLFLDIEEWQQDEELVFGNLESASFEIGGSQEGFEGILDEWGVYFQDQLGRSGIDGDVFLRVMRSLLGSQLVYAQGFSSRFLPDEVEVEGTFLQDFRGISLYPGSRLILPRLTVDPQTWELRAGLEYEDVPLLETEISSLPQEGEEVPQEELVPSPEPRIIAWNGEQGLAHNLNDQVPLPRIRFSEEHGAEWIAVETGNAPLEILHPLAPEEDNQILDFSQGVNFVLDNPQDSGKIILLREILLERVLR